MEDNAHDFEPDIPDDLPEADDEVSSSGSSATPLKAIRRHCLDCCNGSSNEVAHCAARRCSVWTLRFGRRPAPELLAEPADLVTHPQERRATQDDVATGSRLKAIRRRCLDCSGASPSEVAACKHVACGLHPYRLGKNPSRARHNLSDEMRAAIAIRLAGHRSGKRS